MATEFEDESQYLPAVTGALATAPDLGEDTWDKIEEIIAGGTPKNSRQALLSDLRYIDSWFQAIGEEGLSYPVPPAYVLRFIAEHVKGLPPEVEHRMQRRPQAAGRKRKSGPHAISTVTRRVRSLSTAHTLLKLANPCYDADVKLLLAKARVDAVRQGYRPEKKQALHKTRLKPLLEACAGESLEDKRDRALILFGFATGGRRRTEIADAAVEDLRAVDEGYVYLLRYSKSDQAGRGAPKPLKGMAAEAMRAWLAASGIETGKIFRRVRPGRPARIVGDGLNDRSIARILKKRAGEAGLDPSQVSGHSLRRGFMTESRRQNVIIEEAMKLASIKTPAVAIGYYEADNALNSPAADLLG